MLLAKVRILQGIRVETSFMMSEETDVASRLRMPCEIEGRVGVIRVRLHGGTAKGSHETPIKAARLSSY
eukprot:CAMPEP_0172909164 /NCGR_PEP_ID=MMETSP1075-20121228/182166_1 /TAXON_ID=2916 /ORGANISM="Ceratium fusus, Strain PA161109" /LENGTH=68 /DNA_ID=CAMNT_0013767053 /DNA_START=492 /DNA_END=698 /DNA_ORIENTATION=+